MATAGPMFTPVEELLGKAIVAAGDLVEVGAKPIEPLVDPCSLLTRRLAHRTGIAVSPRNRLGDPEAGRSASVRGVADKPAFAVDQVFNDRIDIQ